MAQQIIGETFEVFFMRRKGIEVQGKVYYSLMASHYVEIQSRLPDWVLVEAHEIRNRFKRYGGVSWDE